MDGRCGFNPNGRQDVYLWEMCEHRQMEVEKVREWEEETESSYVMDGELCITCKKQIMYHFNID